MCKCTIRVTSYLEVYTDIMVDTKDTLNISEVIEILDDIAEECVDIDPENNVSVFDRAYFIEHVKEELGDSYIDHITEIVGDTLGTPELIDMEDDNYEV